MDLGVETKLVKNRAVLRLKGRLVAGEEADKLESEVRSQLDQHLDVVLNLKEITFVDSSGLGAMVRLRVQAQARKLHVVLCEVTQRQRDLLRMTNLEPLFQIYESEAAAVEAEAVPVKRNTGPIMVNTVVCIDSSMQLLTYLTSILRAKGYHAVSVNNFPDASALLKMPTTKFAVFGPNPLASHYESPADELRKLAPNVPFVMVENDDNAERMAENVIQAVAAKIPSAQL